MTEQAPDDDLGFDLDINDLPVFKPVRKANRHYGTGKIPTPRGFVEMKPETIARKYSYRDQQPSAPAPRPKGGPLETVIRENAEHRANEWQGFAKARATIERQALGTQARASFWERLIAETSYL